MFNNIDRLPLGKLLQSVQTKRKKPIPQYSTADASDLLSRIKRNSRKKNGN